MSKILAGLNSAQRDAVSNVSGPVMIVAGAGSGKTRVLTHRIALLLERGVRPWEVLALTFTNKAAQEMKSRIALLLDEMSETALTEIGPELARDLWMGTFHSIFARILRKNAAQIGYTSSFTIYDSDDSLGAIKQAMNALSISKDQFNPSAVRSRISSAKNQMVSPEEYMRLARDVFSEQVAQIYPEYTRALKMSNAMDFDDLLLKTVELFDRNPDILAQYLHKFHYILVDEYQDTNRVQYAIIKRLAGKHGNLTVVGDDAQSIYAFRGADIGNILDFERDYPGALTFRLEQNYRSTKSILAAADELIKNNKGQIPKTLFTENPRGELVRITQCLDERDEASSIVRAIEDEIRKSKLDLKDFAVLYRTNAQSRAIEDGLRRQGIPYTIIGGTAFYKRKEIKDVLGYVRLLVNPNDTESLSRVINNPPRGIGATTMEHVALHARNHDQTVMQALSAIEFVGGVQSRAVQRIREFTRLIRKYTELRDKMSVSELLRALIDETGMLQELKLENTIEAMTRRENIQEFLSAVTEYFHEQPDATLESFLEEVALVSEVDQADGSKNVVTLMTLHAAKGLEYPVVCIAGLEDGLFPSIPVGVSREPSEIEEERRLFYVGITRAMKRCFVFYAQERLRFGETTRALQSRFIEEIEKSGSTEHVTSFGTKPQTRKPFDDGYESDRPSTSHLFSGSPVVNGRTFTRKRREHGPGDRTSLEDQTNYSQIEDDRGSPISRGSRVFHEVFGEGRIIEIRGAGDKAKATVEFSKYGRKNLMLKFANLKAL